MKNIETQEEWKALCEASRKKPVIVFKHSASCSISLHVFDVLKRSEENADLPEEIHLVVIQENRDISDSIAADTGIVHQSPQVIVLSGGKAIFSSSHYDIDPQEVAQACGSN